MSISNFFSTFSDTLSGIGNAVGAASNIYSAVRGFGSPAAPSFVPGVPAGAPAASILPVPPIAAPTTSAPVVSSGPGEGNFFHVARRHLGAFTAAQNAPVHPQYDLLTMGQPDDREAAKLMLRGLIPANSDQGQILAASGARPVTKSIRLSNGGTARVQVFEVKGARGARRKRAWRATPARVRNAAKTMRAIAREIRTYDGLAKLGHQSYRKLHPKRATAGKR